MLQRIRSSKDEGFTLIELLIVIIILGILAAIVVFAVGSTRKDAVNSACKTDVKSIQLGVEAYKTKSGVYPTAAGATGSDNILATSTTTNGQVLKAWPGGTSLVAASTDDLAFKYVSTPATGAVTGYNLIVYGKNLANSGAAAGTLNQDATDAQVETACTSS